ncbi:Hypothetical protein PHPALM_17263 [Phytophthora palmivora]|uniref:Uncharacterized protein n=1 Tax=Phytophthora palmivora TaxID=4796 RepID=A0A2P4XMN5_9STRA|nr:Hypothetical protein PHPALM_17263 [Phytophthora palmivora]
MTNLTNSIECDLPGGKGMSAYEMTRLRLSIVTAAGPVNIVHPMLCLILESASDEVLLRGDMLKMLGIDIERQLERRQAETMVTMVTILVLGYGPPADVRPMVVRMKSGYRPYKPKVNKCAPEYQVFLESFNDMLVKLGWVYENPMSRWLAPRYRYANVETLDYKPFNVQSEPMGGLMPNLHVDLENVRGSNSFGLFIKGCCVVFPVNDGEMLRAPVVQALVTVDR